MTIFNKLLTKKTLICLGIFCLLAFFVPVEVLAQSTEKAGSVDVGPFAAFLKRAAKLFMQTRNALFVLAAFAFIAYAWKAIQDGKIEWEKIFYLIVGLTILGVAGWVVSYMVNPEQPNQVITDYENLDNSYGWGDRAN